MNAYFSRTPEDFNYDGAQPGAGDLHDLRVATRDEIERLEKLLAMHCGWIESTAKSDVSCAIDLTGRIEDLERITKIQDDDIDYNDDRIRDLMAAGTVDHGKYAHLTEAQIDELVTALDAYANPDQWDGACDSIPTFKHSYMDPWELAVDALRTAGLK